MAQSILIAQRISALCCGYKDLNDHDRLRHDSILQTALGRDELLSSSPTLCRTENRASSGDAAGLSRVLFEQFIHAHAHASAPEQIVRDIDASDIPLYGDQECREFHGYAACPREGGEPSVPSLLAALRLLR